MKKRERESKRAVGAVEIDMPVVSGIGRLSGLVHLRRPFPLQKCVGDFSISNRLFILERVVFGKSHSGSICYDI